MHEEDAISEVGESSEGQPDDEWPIGTEREGWQRHLTESGVPYFYNTATFESRWECPLAPLRR